MEKLNLVIYNPNGDNPILTNRIEHKDYSGENKRQELKETLEYHCKLYGGIGLSSNQIGLEERAFIANGVVYFNPEIIQSPDTAGDTSDDDYNIMSEGCLSFPKAKASIERCTWVKVIYINEDGEEVEELLDGMDAIVFQHEIDHLNGVTMPDRIKSKLMKKKFWDKYKKAYRKL